MASSEPPEEPGGENSVQDMDQGHPSGISGAVSVPNPAESVSSVSVTIQNNTVQNAATEPATPAVSAGPTWADRSQGRPHEFRVHLVKTGEVENIKMTLTNAEKGRLVKRLQIPQGKLLSCCDATAGVLVLKVAQDVRKADLNLGNAIAIRTGLRTKPIAPVVKEKLVKLFWTKVDTPDEKIVDALSVFGKFTGNIMYQTFRAGKDATEDERFLDGALKGDRYFYMKIARNIPTYVVIDGKRCKLSYDKQTRTCARCNREWPECPGRGNANACEEAGGDKVDIFEWWEELTGQHTEIMNDLQRADFLELSNVPDDVSVSQMQRWLAEKGSINVAEHQVEQISDSRWKVSDLMPEEIKCCFWFVHGSKMFYDGKESECRIRVTKCDAGDLGFDGEKGDDEEEDEATRKRKEDDAALVAARLRAIGQGEGDNSGSESESNTGSLPPSRESSVIAGTPQNLDQHPRVGVKLARTAGGTRTVSVIEADRDDLTKKVSETSKKYAECVDKDSDEGKKLYEEMQKAIENIQDAEKGWKTVTNGKRKTEDRTPDKDSSPSLGGGKKLAKKSKNVKNDNKPSNVPSRASSRILSSAKQ